jgi:D-arabinose 1-dehydrogenase-like Zn-dependent alcohol dehydrogenase
MRAAVLPAIGRPLEIREIPRPEIGPDEVLIETHACGICRTDVHIQDGLAYVPSLPHVPGHEPAGVVVEVGKRVNSVILGQRVVPHLFLTCGACPSCRGGQDAQCLNVSGIIGVTTAGGFAEYFKAPARNLLTLPDNVSFDVGGLASCAVITAVHAFRRAIVGVGDTAIVLGTGGIGQILIQILKNAGVQVIGISRSDASLAIASEVGADLCVLAPHDGAVEQVSAFTQGRGATVVFECVGIAATMKLASECVSRRGQIVVIGEEDECPEINTIQIAQREISIVGSRNGSMQDAEDALRLMSLRVIAPPIVRRIALDEINEGLNMVRDGSAHGRVVVTMQ